MLSVWFFIKFSSSQCPRNLLTKKQPQSCCLFDFLLNFRCLNIPENYYLHPIKVHNIYTYIFIHALSGLGPSAHIYSVKNLIYLNLFFFNTSLLTFTYTLIALVAIKVKSFAQNFLLRTY